MLIHEVQKFQSSTRSRSNGDPKGTRNVVTTNSSYFEFNVEIASLLNELALAFICKC